VWDWDLTTGLAIWDEGTTRMLGYEPNELIPDVRTWKRSVNLDDWAKVSEALNAHLSGQTPFYEAEYRMRTKSGELKWFYSRGKVIEYDAEGKPLRIVGTTHDITQRRQAIEDLKRKTEEQELLLNTIDIQIWYLTDPMTYGLVNQSRADFVGKPREELEGKRLDDFYSHDVAAICELSNAEAFQTRCTVHTEEWIPNAAGEPRLISITKTPKLDEYGNVEYVVCAGSDITERKRTEDALRDNNERYQDLYRMIRLMCDNVPDMIWAKDLNGRFLFVNRAICEKLLIANDTTEPIGKYDMYFAERQRQANPDDPNWHTFGENCVDSDAVVMTSKKPQRFHESGNVRGQFLYLDVYKAPFLNEKGKMIGTVGCGRDVTMERKLEDSLRERKVVQIAC
ncbi:MAG: PAS domain-containing protein, partial [Desulfomonilaceae bacterium]